ncbi:DUF99 domain-containing protein [Haloferax sp. Atlit-10N]|uniref:endonuclease dU n=1 Tax=unclassified Haloferax TaxID=2625095 RepID=UPI000E25A9B1|nr:MULTISPECIES: DUF99 family protein [unclassified Haloferax]RDZ43895.1 DUF99 domain-containing protein [Haloferax sp. Atlit-19N]RDZ46228.1 DUF99 domain-containing protein [Haloferax sp. Atlit-16N]RDZ60061.1 DUF99 domain-containing protein [Haloferax sp. Atlit-10N]
MKPGSRALGVAESSPGAARAPTDDADDAHFSTDPSPESVLCGAVVRADRVVDGLAFETCTVGGDDATHAIASLYASLGREDVRYLLVSGIAPAWFNLVDVERLAADLDRPVVSVSFEESEGLEPALAEQFSGAALDRRLATYRAAPPRRPLDVNGETVFVRAAGCDDDEAARVVRGFTPTGGRPEPIRVARMAARAARRFAGD